MPTLQTIQRLKYYAKKATNHLQEQMNIQDHKPTMIHPTCCKDDATKRFVWLQNSTGAIKRGPIGVEDWEKYPLGLKSISLLLTRHMIVGTTVLLYLIISYYFESPRIWLDQRTYSRMDELTQPFYTQAQSQFSNILLGGNAHSCCNFVSNGI